MLTFSFCILGSHRRRARGGRGAEILVLFKRHMPPFIIIPDPRPARKKKATVYSLFFHIYPV